MTGESSSSSPFKLYSSALDLYQDGLTGLIEGIAMYGTNSEQVLIQADRLVAAEDQLTHAIGELSRHQNTLSRIRTLQDESSKLDTTLRQALAQLSDIRDDLLKVDSTTTTSTKIDDNDDDNNKKSVDYLTLLEYAMRISKYTSAPPGFMANFPGWQQQLEASRGGGDGQQQGQSSETRPPPLTESDESNNNNNNNNKNNINSPASSQLLEDMSHLVANYPWPSEDEMRKGCLALYNIRQQGDDDGSGLGPGGEAAVKSPSEKQSSSPRPTATVAPQQQQHHHDAAAAGTSSRDNNGLLEMDLFDPDME